MKVLTALSILALFAFTSCQKCEECTLTTTTVVSGAGNQTDVRTGSYCGSELKEIKDNSSYEKDGVKYSWTCEAE